MGTMYPKPNEIRRDWWVVDLSGQTLGRAASQIASLLRGKHKPIFTPHADAGDFVIVINAEKVKLTGRKLDQKLYHSHTGFLGHMKSVPARQMLADKPEELIKQAVRRMLPRNANGRATFSKLKIYAGAEHPHSAQNPKPFTPVA
ncbi:MAG: 50S ribosomal protein L13 [Deltaproteobacteria bacterium]|nr:50S ribosomal protein L13 [Deltaproteobacteria bacterium]MBK8237443.1 50S ribosomal protein L13 [Deltaproteobacteria bacterium]MBP7285566.1 50S ribosomal protein L13 [Nannocystaceae bacterium]